MLPFRLVVYSQGPGPGVNKTLWNSWTSRHYLLVRKKMLWNSGTSRHYLLVRNKTLWNSWTSRHLLVIHETLWNSWTSRQHLLVIHETLWNSQTSRQHLLVRNKTVWNPWTSRQHLLVIHKTLWDTWWEFYYSTNIYSSGGSNSSLVKRYLLWEYTRKSKIIGQNCALILITGQSLPLFSGIRPLKIWMIKSHYFRQKINICITNQLKKCRSR